MPRHRRRRYGSRRRRYSRKSSRPATRLRKKLKRRPTALQALALKNSRAIKKLQQVTSMRSLWKLEHTDSGVYEPYRYTQLIFPSMWSPIFNSDLRVNESNPSEAMSTLAWKGSHIDIHALIQVSSQTQYVPISCCYVVFRPRKNIAQQFATNTINGSKLQEDVHYTMTTTGIINGKAMWMFNTDILDILYINHFMVSEYIGEGTAGLASSEDHAQPYTGNVKDANKNLHIRIPYRKLLKTDNSYNDGSAAQDREYSWTQLQDSDIAPEDRIYCCLFNNAPGIQVAPPEDQKLFWSQNVTFHGRTSSSTRTHV